MVYPILCRNSDIHGKLGNEYVRELPLCDGACPDTQQQVELGAGYA